MAGIVDVKFTTNKEEVLTEVKDKIVGWLNAIGQDASETSASVLYRTGTIDTGNLVNSISPSVDEANLCVYIGTDVKYAIYHEFGTGIYAEGGTGRQEAWMFQDSKGEWHWTHGVPAKHFIQFGATAHQAEYKAMLEASLRE